jgi:hypothetical protein
MTARIAIRIHQNTAAARLSLAAISAFKISSCDSIGVFCSCGYTADLLTSVQHLGSSRLLSFNYTLRTVNTFGNVVALSIRIVINAPSSLFSLMAWRGKRCELKSFPDAAERLKDTETALRLTGSLQSASDAFNHCCERQHDK